jgi:hypothetical protein
MLDFIKKERGKAKGCKGDKQGKKCASGSAEGRGGAFLLPKMYATL